MRSRCGGRRLPTHLSVRDSLRSTTPSTCTAAGIPNVAYDGRPQLADTVASPGARVTSARLPWDSLIL